jgi:hypothetical protein
MQVAPASPFIRQTYHALVRRRKTGMTIPLIFLAERPDELSVQQLKPEGRNIVAQH